MRPKPPNSQPVTVNIVPMLDVMMTVLTFFIILSMVLGRQSTVDITLPSSEEESKPTVVKEQLPPPLVIEQKANGQILLKGKPVPKDAVIAAAKAYLEQNVKGAVFLKPDRDLPYEEVLKFLGALRALDKERVSLGIDDPAAESVESVAPEVQAPAETTESGVESTAIDPGTVEASSPEVKSQANSDPNAQAETNANPDEAPIAPNPESSPAVVPADSAAPIDGPGND